MKRSELAIALGIGSGRSSMESFDLGCRNVSSILIVLTSVISTALLSACGSGNAGTTNTTPSPQPQAAITVTLTPNTAQMIDQGQMKQFTATVANDSANKGVSWTLTQNGTACSPGCGTIAPATTASGAPTAYTAPAAVNTNLQFSVIATSVADASKSASDSATALPPPALNNPPQLPAATAGQPYSFQLTESGGVPPYTWSVVSGSLPNGLKLDSSTGVISGTPTAASAMPRLATAMAASGTSTQNCFMVQVVDTGTPPLTNMGQVCINVGPAPVVAACGANPPPAGAPSITVQPQSQTIALPASNPVQFSVNATSASGLTYQWFVGVVGPPVPLLSPISGATSQTYTIPQSSLSGAFTGLQYVVKVSNSVCSILSNGAVLVVTQNPNGKGQIQIPTIQQANGTIVLTHAGASQYFACQSSTSIGGNNPSCPPGAPNININWSLALNGQACSPTCGSVVPATTLTGMSTTYVAPTDVPLAGEYPTLIATSADDSTEFATALIRLTPCSPGDPMCGEFTFLIQGFDANGKPTAAAGHFTGTGLANGNTMITDGVMDINDSDGIDAGVSITSGFYTFDKDAAGNLLPNLNDLTGTITLNTSSTTPSHKQRNYAFTAGAQGGPFDGWPLIEYEPNQIGKPPATNPANGFQGSGSIWPIVAPGPYTFPIDVTGRPTCSPGANCNYAFQFSGSGSSGLVGSVGVFNVSVDSNNNCLIGSGPSDVVQNRPGAGLLAQPPIQGTLSGNCGALASANGVADDVNGRGTATLGFNNACTDPNHPCDTFAYYVMARAALVFVDITAAGSTLSGVAHLTGLSSTTHLSTLGCGTVIEIGQTPNCVIFTSGSQSAGAVLTTGQFTCAPPAEASCNEKVASERLTGQLSATIDQMVGGNLNNPVLNPCPHASASNPMPPVCNYSIDTATGVGYICVDANTPGCPNGATDSHALTYADGFLLANDASAAVGLMSQQLFFCSTPCAPGPQPFENNDPGPFVGGTIPSSSDSVPNVTGAFKLSAPASNCPTPDNFDSGALFTSGLDPVAFTLSIPPTPSISGCFGFDNANNPLITGRGTGTSNSPGPANFVFYEISPLHLIAMESDNTIPGGQVFLNLISQAGTLTITSASSTSFNVAGPGTFTVTATGAARSTPSAPPSAPPLSWPFTMPNTAPNGITFTDNGNGTATLSKAAATGTPGTYVFVITAHDTSSTAIQGCRPQGSDACQAFVLTIQ